ncbi:glycosyltransferase [Sulfurimonas sp.]|jgi:glycosyltransferase involved in cell wall biosynthesis|uniref:glycosyltransferase n=2 Tax=Sulfurimonas sp. TaxID=2022749 RepID=UPI001BBDAD2D|nr:glycosyltransferase [Sulfurimonas sp.]MBS4067762.1 glycosyltransferase [Sulfurimonas sp.]MDD3854344.1 glycosyltransferase [Sulfurimonas sp.]
MGKEPKVIRVGFIGAVSKEWMGGLNYFKNLLYAIKSIDNNLQITVFVGKKTDIDIKNMFKKYAIVIEDGIFDRKSVKWFLHKIETKILRTNFLLERLLNKHHIDLLSHSSITGLKICKTINWIPDFQHLHLPEMFSKKEIEQRNKDFLNLIKQSDKIVLSSYDALEDFKTFAPKYTYKASVLQFVSQPDSKYFDLNENDKINLIEKYNLPDIFFYVPNQFWKHKNHMLVFEAVKLLVSEGGDICIVCTGYLNDYRNAEYITTITKFIEENKLHNNIRLLGLVDYEDVFKFIKFSKAVINPSLFEGWSSTVEECKSVDKNMILSDLDVHKEQYLEALFFDRFDAQSLKKILKSYSCENSSFSSYDLKERTKSFAQKYIGIVNDVINN